MRLLLIEDDATLARSLSLMLRAEGFMVETAGLGADGAELAKLYSYDLILLDLSLPDLSGVEVLRGLRLAKIATPVMILSGSAEIATKLDTFAVGGDDYMTKPFHAHELVARILAVVRRSQGHAHSIIQTGNLTVNVDTKAVSIDGERIYLTRKEFQILELLSLRKGVIVSKEMFLDHLYGGIDEPEMKIIDVFVCKLRKKLAGAGGHRHIETCWGHGYVLNEPQDQRAAA
ncbi:response regulator transcription factor [Brevundimonas sp.]|uniref:response regulator transcription factor n=1 Tax=Brevundimonas sp. TaxID=1871086 RepID=UPI002AB9E053|nr:response regulator transcription factor [Brevundimonas sp.]MDZ4365034.1 response regulator transcription factor [Brevundimonas sp.]